MARNIEEILKEQLGNLVFQLSIMQSKVETLTEENEKLKVAEPGAKMEQLKAKPNEAAK